MGITYTYNPVQTCTAQARWVVRTHFEGGSRRAGRKDQRWTQGIVREPSDSFVTVKMAL